MQNKKDVVTIPVATRITKPMLEEIHILLKTNSHINTADYIRDLIRRDLEMRGIQWKIDNNYDALRFFPKNLDKNE